MSELPTWLANLGKKQPTYNLPNNGGSFNLSALSGLQPTNPGLIQGPQTPQDTGLTSGTSAKSFGVQQPALPEVPQPTFTETDPTLGLSQGQQTQPQVPQTTTPPVADTSSSSQSKIIQDITNSQILGVPLGSIGMENGYTGSMPSSEALRIEMMKDRAQGTGLYSIPKGENVDINTILAIRTMADKHYSDLIGTASEVEKNELQKANISNKPELTSGQASAFNAIVSAKNKSPLLAASDRLPVLQNAIKEARANPSNGALQLNLVYSYVQALDTYQSAVREGELSLVNSIDSKVGQLGNFVSQIQNGQIVRPEVINQMADAAENIVNTINTSAKQKSKSFKAQAEAQGLGDVWNKYEGGYDASYDSKVSNPDQEALDAGYSQEEIDAFKKSQGFKSVGNTSASIEIPKESRLSYVNNNPGNLRFANQSGATPGEGGFAKFPTPEAGVKALTSQVKLDQGRGHTLASFIAKFAPPSENNTAQYISQAAKSLGVTSDTSLASIPTDKLTKFMALKESSTKIL